MGGGGGGEGKSFHFRLALKAINVCGVYIFLNLFRLLLVMYYLGCLPRSPSRRSVTDSVIWRDQVSSNQDFSPDG